MLFRSLIIESNSFFNWGTKGNQVVAGCKPQWNGGNLPGNSFNIRQIGLTSAQMSCSIDRGNFGFTCGTYIGYYVCNAFSCFHDNTFTFVRATNSWLGSYDIDDITSTWPETILVHHLR